jgi:hypothetical protein
VHPDPHADDHVLGPVGLEQVALGGDGGRDRVPRAAEREEEGVALTVYFVPAVPAEGRPEQAVMLLEQGPVLVAESTHEPRRAFDVAEEERDRPRGRRTVPSLRYRRRAFRCHDCGLSVTFGLPATTPPCAYGEESGSPRPPRLLRYRSTSRSK